MTQQVTVERQPTTVVQTITPAPEDAPGPQPGADAEEAAALNDEAFDLMQEGDWEER